MRRKVDTTGQMSLLDYLNMLDKKDDPDNNEKEGGSDGFSSPVVTDSGAIEKMHTEQKNHVTGDFTGHITNECNIGRAKTKDASSTDKIPKTGVETDAATENEIHEIISRTFEKSDELREKVCDLKDSLLLQRVYGLKELYRLYPSFTMSDSRTVSFSSLGMRVGTKEDYREYSWKQIERSVFRKEQR